jgi:hypothetical protein
MNPLDSRYDSEPKISKVHKRQQYSAHIIRNSCIPFAFELIKVSFSLVLVSSGSIPLRIVLWLAPYCSVSSGWHHEIIDWPSRICRSARDTSFDILSLTCRRRFGRIACWSLCKCSPVHISIWYHSSHPFLCSILEWHILLDIHCIQFFRIGSLNFRSFAFILTIDMNYKSMIVQHPGGRWHKLAPFVAQVWLGYSIIVFLARLTKLLRLHWEWWVQHWQLSASSACPSCGNIPFRLKFSLSTTFCVRRSCTCL